jgi:malonyl-CoA O-methyltransferase
MPFSLPLIDMHYIGDMLVHSRFSNPVVHTQKINLDYKNSNIKAIMQDLHAFGLLFNTNSELKLNNNYTKLASLFSHINSIELEVVYAHAWKVEQKSTKNHNQEQIINIDKLHRKN